MAGVVGVASWATATRGPPRATAKTRSGTTKVRKRMSPPDVGALSQRFDGAHHAVVLVQQDVAVEDPTAGEVGKLRAHRELAEGRDAGRVLVVAHRDRLPIYRHDLIVVDV